jgi:hypothetical protein
MNINLTVSGIHTENIIVVVSKRNIEVAREIIMPPFINQQVTIYNLPTGKYTVSTYESRDGFTLGKLTSRFIYNPVNFWINRERYCYMITKSNNVINRLMRTVGNHKQFKN